MLETTLEPNAPTGLEIALPAFSGPLDLLLHLIQKNRLSVYDIPIALICDQYHRHLRAMEELDLEVAAEFLWMASWLLELKSRMLLPRSEEAAEDPRQELVERLLEYRRCKELAAVLHDRDTLRRCLWEPRLEAAVESEEAELELEDLDLRRLAQTYLDVMKRWSAAHPPPLTVEPLRFKVEDTMRDLYQRVLEDGLVPLLRMLNRSPDVDEMVVLVVAVLELVRLGGVRAEQRVPFAEVFLRPGPVTLDATRLLQLGGAVGA